MYFNQIISFNNKIFIILSLIILFDRFVLVVDTAKQDSPSTNRQMCSKLQSMLSYGKYQTSQISTNISYTSRAHTPNFLAYSSIDDLLLFIEPKHHINVYNAQTVQLLINISTSDVAIAASTTSLSTDSRQDLYFVYQTNTETNLISLRICQVHFNMLKLTFENNLCLETIIIQYDQPNLRIYGLTIKRNHAGTKKSLLFISSDIGLIYTIFDTYTGSLINESTIMNETLNEGSIVLSSSGAIYYASKQEHLIYELHITKDFRLRYGNVIKTNSIKYPFGLITDQCNHLYIASRSMILIMFLQTRSTIRSVFSISSDLPIPLERLNSTTYVYATIRKHSGKGTAYWMFNFLYFTESDKLLPLPRRPVVNWKEQLDMNDTNITNTDILKLWPVSYTVLAQTNITKKKYIEFSALSRKPSYQTRRKISKQFQTTISTDDNILLDNNTELFTSTPPIEQSLHDLSDDNGEVDDNTQFESIEQINQLANNEEQPDPNLMQDKSADPSSSSSHSSKSITPIDDSQKEQNETLNGKSQSTTPTVQQPSYSYSFVQYLNSTLTPQLNRPTNSSEIISEDDIKFYLQGQKNFTSNQEVQIQAYLARQSSNDYNIFSKYSKTTSKPNTKHISVQNTSSAIENEENLLPNDDIHSQDYKAKQPFFDSKSRNRTIHIDGTIFTVDDIESYLEGRKNFSSKQERQIQTYLAKQSSTDDNIFSKYSNTTNKPGETYIPDNTLTSELQRNTDTLTKDKQSINYTTKQPIFDLESVNQTTDADKIVFSDEDVQSYLQGQANLTIIQKTQIQVYLSKQLSSNPNLFSNYMTTTKKPVATFISDNNISSAFQKQDNTSVIKDRSSNVSISDLKSINRTIDIADTIFSEDDVQAYLQGRTNLTAVQEIQIQAYIAQKLSSIDNTFSKYSTSTKAPKESFILNDNVSTQSSTDVNFSFDQNTQSKRPLINSTLSYHHYNSTVESLESIISDEDLKSYLQGRSNLSRIQETQIEIYLAKQSSSNYSIFSRYSTSTKSTTNLNVSHDYIGTQIFDDDTQSRNYSTKQPSFDSDLYSEHFDYLTNLNETIIPPDELQAFMEGRANLSTSQKIQIQTYLARQSSTYDKIFTKYTTSTISSYGTGFVNEKLFSSSSLNNISTFNENSQQLQSDIKLLNRTTDTNETLFSNDDLQSYIQGRENLSPEKKTQIEAYLAKQSSSPFRIFSKYSTTRKKPTRTLNPNRTISSELQRNLSFAQDVEYDDYPTTSPPSDSESYTLPKDSKVLFSDDDLQSYIQGRENLSPEKKTHIEAYLASRSSSLYRIFSKYSITTEKPRSSLSPGRNISFEVQKQRNISSTNDVGSDADPTVLFSDDDLQSYMQGGGNLSPEKKAQIETYLANQSASPSHVFSRYSTTTKKPRRTLNPDQNISSKFQQQSNLSSTGDAGFDDYSEELLPADTKSYNRTTDSKILFSDDDLNAYIQGHGNISQDKTAQIQAYLAKQSSSTYRLFSKLSTATKEPRRTLEPGNDIQSAFQKPSNLSLIEDLESDDYLEELSVSGPNSHNRTIDSQVLFSDDDFNAYIQGRTNVSVEKEAQIQAYLAKQSSSPPHIFSKHSTTTKKPNRTSIPYSDIPFELQRQRNLSRTEDIEFGNESEDLSSFDTKSHNRTTDEKVLFSDDDLQSYIEGRENLSPEKKIQIQTYLAKQSSSPHNIFAKYLTSTKMPRRTSVSDPNIPSKLQRQTNLSLTEDTEANDLPSLDTKSYNRTADSQELFSDDDLQSYIEGRGHLSPEKKEQIQNYLAKQSSSSHNIFSKYVTSTKIPRRTSVFDPNIPLELQRQRNLSRTEDNQTEGYSQERSPLDHKYYNRTIDPDQIYFTNEDLQSYLDGRTNLSKSQEEQIQAYLNKQSFSNHTIFHKYSTSTKLPTKGQTLNGSSYPDSQGRTSQSPRFDSKYFNYSTESKEILFSEDDLQSYLHGQGNLSLTQQTQIQAYLAKQTSLENKTLSRYFTSTRKTTKLLTYDEKFLSYYEGQTSPSEDQGTQSSGSFLQKLTSTVPYATRTRTNGRQPSDDYINSNNNENTSTEISTKYSQLPTSTSLTSRNETDLSSKSPKSITTDDVDADESFHSPKDELNRSSTKIRPSGEHVPVTVPSDITKSDFVSNQKFKTTDSINTQSSSSLSSFDQLLEDVSDENVTRPTGNDVTRLFDNNDQQKSIQHDDDEVNYFRLSTKLKSTINPKFSSTISGQSISTNMTNISSHKTPVPTVNSLLPNNTDYTSTSFKSTSYDNTTNTMPLSLETDPTDTLIGIDQTQLPAPKVNDKTTIPSSHQTITSFQNQSTFKNMSISYNDTEARYQNESINIQRSSTLSTLVVHDTVNSNTKINDVNNNTQDEFSQKYWSSLSVDKSLSSIPHSSLSSSPFAPRKTTSLPSRHSSFTPSLHRSLSSSITKSPLFTRYSLSKHFSEIEETTATTALESLEEVPTEPRATTMRSYSTIFPLSTSKLQSSHKFSTMQTTAPVITSNIPKQKSITTLSDKSTSLLTTFHPGMKPTVASTPSYTINKPLFTTKSEQHTSKSSKTYIQTSTVPYTQSTRLFTTSISKITLPSATVMLDRTSTYATMTSTNEENLALSNANQPLKTTDRLARSSILLPSSTNRYQNELITTQSPFELTSRILPYLTRSTTVSTLEHTTSDTIYLSSTSTLPYMRRPSFPSLSTTTTIEGQYRTWKPKTTIEQTQLLTTTTTMTTTIPIYQTTTSVYRYLSVTSTDISMWRYEWNSLDQQGKNYIQPSLIKNDSNRSLTNELLNQIFNNISSSTNSSSEKSIYVDLSNIPPSSWNFSLNSNESILLNVTLPSPVYPLSSSTITNLTFTNIEANRFSTKINGVPINLQVDRVQTKQFSLTMNTTDHELNRTDHNRYPSEVIIGHVKSEQFELNLTKSDNMHVHVRQVDSATAELYLDSNFCTNESSLEINLNLSKNGTIRYGNRKPIHIGPVFTRVHMLKQSCDREQPLTLFFDICQRQNPCFNAGTCLAVMPDYNDKSYIHTETGHVGYKCQCPLHTSGEHCQYLEYPLGYCLNNGTLLQIYDRFNQSIEKCFCSTGFQGEHCEENIDNCLGVECSNHGICEDGIETYRCACYDGFYGFNCEKTNVQTIILQAASRSFGVVAILLIITIACLVVASDIHTYLTRKQQKTILLNKIPRVTSELFENSVLLLGFSDAPIEMNDLSNLQTNKKVPTLKIRQIRKTTRYRKAAGYRQLPKRRVIRTFQKTSTRSYLASTLSK